MCSATCTMYMEINQMCHLSLIPIRLYYIYQIIKDALHWLHNSHGFCSILICNQWLAYLSVHVHDCIYGMSLIQTERSQAEVGKCQLLNLLAVCLSILGFLYLCEFGISCLCLVLLFCASLLISQEILKNWVFYLASIPF